MKFIENGFYTSGFPEGAEYILGSTFYKSWGDEMYCYIGGDWHHSIYDKSGILKHIKYVKHYVQCDIILEDYELFPKVEVLKLRFGDRVAAKCVETLLEDGHIEKSGNKYSYTGQTT